MAPADKPEPTPFRRFEAFAKKIVKVPKREIDEKQREHQAKREKRPKRT